MSHPRRILVVEDDYLIGMHIADTLAGAGFAAQLATTVEEARSLFLGHPFDTVVLDFRLGDKLSLGLADELRAANVPFVFCTGSVVDEVQKIYPGARVVAKPFREDELVGTVAELAAA